MQRIGYRLLLNLAGFLFTEIEKRVINGVEEDCLIIPMRINGLRKSKANTQKGVFCYGTAIPLDKNKFGQSHMLVANPKEKEQNEREELGYDRHSIIGNLSVIFSKYQKDAPMQKGIGDNIDKILYSNF